MKDELICSHFYILQHDIFKCIEKQLKLSARRKTQWKTITFVSVVAFLSQLGVHGLEVKGLNKLYNKTYSSLCYQYMVDD